VRDQEPSYDQSQARSETGEGSGGLHRRFERSGGLEHRVPRELILLENERQVTGQGSYEKVTATHPGRAILDGVAGAATASNHGVIQIGGYVYEGLAEHSGHLFIDGNADKLTASFGGTIYLKKDLIMEGKDEKDKQKSGHVRVLTVSDGGSAIIEGDADEVIASHEGHAVVRGDVRIARIVDDGDIYVYGKVEEKHLIPGRGHIRTAANP
jgi:hypothetical protein